jgi:hypothetical protein
MTVNPLYPFTIAVHRQKTNAVNAQGVQQVGLAGYSGREQSTNTNDPEGETVLFTGLLANISPKTVGKVKTGSIPADFTEKPQWLIAMQPGVLCIGAIKDEDIIVDNFGYRYGVLQNVFTTLGYQLVTVRLEA